VVFNTSMTGYQEVLTDPSYRGQMVTMTYPLIGNYGVNAEDVESDRIQVAGFVVREYQPFRATYRATGNLADYLRTGDVLGVEALDTRALTRHIRNAGAMRGFISTRDLDPAACRPARGRSPAWWAGTWRAGHHRQALPLAKRRAAIDWKRTPRWTAPSGRAPPPPTGWWPSISASSTISCGS
jgi:hypothetical protein